jgi:hypothetical protein
MAHMIEGTHRYWVVGDKDKLVPVRTLDDPRESTFCLRVKVTIGTRDLVAIILHRFYGVSVTDARKWRGRYDQPAAKDPIHELAKLVLSGREYLGNQFLLELHHVLV